VAGLFFFRREIRSRFLEGSSTAKTDMFLKNSSSGHRRFTGSRLPFIVRHGRVQPAETPNFEPEAFQTEDSASVTTSPGTVRVLLFCRPIPAFAETRAKHLTETKPKYGKQLEMETGRFDPSGARP
jgi:hypothetical protein